MLQIEFMYIPQIPGGAHLGFNINSFCQKEGQRILKHFFPNGFGFTDRWSFCHEDIFVAHSHDTDFVNVFHISFLWNNSTCKHLDLDKSASKMNGSLTKMGFLLYLLWILMWWVCGICSIFFWLIRKPIVPLNSQRLNISSHIHQVWFYVKTYFSRKVQMRPQVRK